MTAATAGGKRRCSRCKRRLPLSSFHAGGRTSTRCIACDRARKRAIREDGPAADGPASVAVPGPGMRRRYDGLVGATAAERAAIEARIDRVRLAKRAARGAELASSLLAAVLDGRRVGQSGPDPGGEMRCSLCHARRPLGEFYYYARAGRHMQPCRACDRERKALQRKTPEYREWRRRRDARPEVRERIREADRRQKARRKERRAAEGPTARERLAQSVLSARYEARRAADPARKAAIEARVRDLLREIERIDREAVA